ncbi:MAG: hypothetical protein SOX38_11585 [Candidatus Limiplasma sp.]|nr:hypothetical protein [Candidatus Limiplasma sp.]
MTGADEPFLKYGSCIRPVAEKYSAVFVPLQDEFDKYLKDVETEYLLWDGVHPTVARHGIIARQWYDHVDKSGIL